MSEKPNFSRVRRRALVALMVLVVGIAVLAPEGSARTQVVKDGKDPPHTYPGFNGVYHGYVPNLKKVTVTQTRDRRMRFTILFGPRPKSLDNGSWLAVRVKRKVYSFDGPGVIRRSKGRRDIIIFPLSLIGDPRSFRWNVSVSNGEFGDSLPNYPKPYFHTFKVAPKDPPKSGGPALRGPSTVKPGKSATYRAFWFTSGSPLTVTLQSKTALGSDREKATITEPVFTAKAGGKTNLKFKFPRTFLPASCGDKSAADCRKKWKPGSEVAVTVCGPPDPPAKVQCARKTSKIFKPKPPKLPVKTIRFRGGKGLMTLRCPQSKKCQGTIEVDHGKSTLVKRQKYTIAAHGKKRLKLRLTKAGRKVLAKSRRVHAIGTLTGKSGKKARFVAILRRG